MKTTLFFATNRNHRGADQWKPEGYGKKFSTDGHFNLRFGELSLSVDPDKVREYENVAFPGNRSGDGEGLSSYLSGLVKKAEITAYRDYTSTTNEHISFERNSSTRLFKVLKKEMENYNDALIYIHGYNVSWEDAAGAAMALQFMLNRNKKTEDKNILVVLFSWPSDGSVMPYAAYKSDRSDARDSAQAIGRGLLKLRDFLVQLQTGSGDDTMRACHQKIHLLCHSMGNYVLQYALKKVKGYTPGKRMPRLFEHIFLCAADIDDDALENEDQMRDVDQLCNHLTVYYNKGDLAMYISDYTKGNPQRLGHAGAAHPQLIHNKIHQVDCSAIVMGLVEHSYYLWATVNDDIGMTIDDVPPDDGKRNRKRLANNREWRLI